MKIWLHLPLKRMEKPFHPATKATKSDQFLHILKKSQLTETWCALLSTTVGFYPWCCALWGVLKMLSLKTVLPLAVTSAKRVSDICALLVSTSYLSIREHSSAATLQPNPLFTHKVLTPSFQSRIISLEGFFPQPQRNEAEEMLYCFCPVHTLCQNVLRTANIWQTEELFVHYKGHSQGVALSNSIFLTGCVMSLHKPTALYIVLESPNSDNS